MTINPKLKVMGIIAKVIAILFNMCLLAFAAFLLINASYSVAIIAANLFIGIVGLVTSSLGIYFIVSCNDVGLAISRNLSIATGLISVTSLIIHTLMPFYSDIELDYFGVQNAFYLIATVYILLGIQSFYSTYLEHLMVKFLREDMRQYSGDVESQSFKRADSLNETGRSFRA